MRLFSRAGLAPSLLLFTAGVGWLVNAAPRSLWTHDNLFAWCVVPFDEKPRDPKERAAMLQRLGFTKFVYDWREKEIPTFDAEIGALQAQGITLQAWWFPFDAYAPTAKAILEVFKRHKVHPQLWVMQSPSHPPAVEDQEQHVTREAERIRALVQLAAPYGSNVELYNHNGWFGRIENELAILEKLRTMGVTGVGLVYNFSHARDEAHDDSLHFPELWKKMKPYVVAVNVTGMCTDSDIVYPSQGDSELEMMRTIEQSGWENPVGLIAEKGGDAEVTLRNYMTGLDWLAAELRQPGSGGPRPFVGDASIRSCGQH